MLRPKETVVGVEVDAETWFTTPGSPLENGYIASFNWKLRDEILDRGSARAIETRQRIKK